MNRTRRSQKRMEEEDEEKKKKIDQDQKEQATFAAPAADDNNEEQERSSSKADDSSVGFDDAEEMEVSPTRAAAAVKAVTLHPKTKSKKKILYRCKICNYATGFRARYTKHVKYHSMPMITCDYCEFKSPYKWNLIRHLNSHNGEGSLKCSICSFATDQKQSLTAHLQNHHTNVSKELLQGQLGTLTANNSKVKSQSHSHISEKSPIKKIVGKRRTLLRRAVENSNKNSNNIQSSSAQSSQDFVHIDDVVERNGNLYLKKLQCTQCSYKAVWDTELSQHMAKSHGQQKTVQPIKIQRLQSSNGNTNFSSTIVAASTTTTSSNLSKPVPSLIPLTNARSSSKSPPILIKRRDSNNSSRSEDSEEKKLSFLEYFDLTPKEKATTKYRSFQNVIRESLATPMTSHHLPSTSSSSVMKTSRLLDQLTKKLVANASTTNDGFAASHVQSLSKNNVIVTLASNSTRCQNCRQRCKTSSDLALHLTVCEQATTNRQYLDDQENIISLKGKRRNSSENKIFVWNNIKQEPEDVDFENDEEMLSQQGSRSSSVMGDLAGFETSSGHGEIQIGNIENDYSSTSPTAVTKTRKVYRCPHNDCNFWAATASRFHVHMVGHQNIKPFECSLCGYHSNWRWDITKHIKLKSLRDPSHSKGKVILTHDSGNKDYRKYDQYLVMMGLKYAADSKLPDCSTVASKRSDVALELNPSSNDDLSVSTGSPQQSPGGSNFSNMMMSPMKLMPKLKRAPIIHDEDSLVLNSGRMLTPPSLKQIVRSPPTLERTIVQKRMLSGGQITASNVHMKKQRTKSTESGSDGKLWSCKRCSLFRHPSKDVVMAHLRTAHKPKKGEPISILSQNNLTNTDDESTINVKGKHEYNETNSLEFMESHAENQFSKQNSYACTHCSFSASTKIELLYHLQMHGIKPTDTTNVNENYNLTTGNDITAEEMPPRPSGGGPYKKYKCIQCPYVTDSKGQFLYHKQFHRPRNCPFKCNKCSYNVSHKHLLHQHLRVHGIGPASPTKELITQSTTSMMNQVDEFDDDDVNHSMPTMLTWTDDGVLTVYRCRSCPQGFNSKSELIQHESTHKDDEDEDINNTFSSGASILNLSLTNGRRNKDIVIKPTTSSSSPANKTLHLCTQCPARFFFARELEIHFSFHKQRSDFKCSYCSYSAREIPHLESHMKVLGQEYQNKTQQLLSKYPRASSTATPLFKRGNGSSSSTTTINVKTSSPSSSVQLQIPTYQPKMKTISISCTKCPAKFQDSTVYQQHLICHEKLSIFKCKYCSFSTDNQKNIKLHEVLHVGTKASLNTPSPSSQAISRIQTPFNNNDLEDAQIGNPDFIYPTYIKNGRVKSKRYKCKRCPSAFEKRDQYITHIGLHGSNQRYTCRVCDYSVTYYANFLQHLKKHATQGNIAPELLEAKPISQRSTNQGSTTSPPKLASRKSSSRTNNNVTADGSLDLSMNIFRCKSCPFVTVDSNSFTQHVAKHNSTKQGTEENRSISTRQKCVFCNFVASSKSDLREHTKAHFVCNPLTNPEEPQSFMYLDNVEIVMDGEKIYSEKENYNNNNNHTQKGNWKENRTNDRNEFFESEQMMDASGPIDCTV